MVSLVSFAAGFDDLLCSVLLPEECYWQTVYGGGVMKHKSFEEWKKDYLADNPETSEEEERVECSECDGTGEVECPECGHEMECEDCYGTGYSNGEEPVNLEKLYAEQCEMDEKAYQRYISLFNQPAMASINAA